MSSLNQRILGPYRISHHPLCEPFSEHVYHIRGKRVCRGCVMQYSGMIVAILIIGLGFIFGWWQALTEIEVGIVLYILICPTVISAFFIDNRIIKDISRFLLGISFSLAFILLIFTPAWLIKGWILLNFIPGYFYLNKKRGQNNHTVCQNCVDYQRIPYCSGYQIYTDREKIFLAQALRGGIHDPFAVSPEEILKE